MANLGELSVEHLRSRVILGSMLIRMLERERDPRAPGAIERLQAQQREINGVLVAKVREERAARGEAEPEAVEVGLRGIELRGEALAGGDVRAQLREIVERFKAAALGQDGVKLDARTQAQLEAVERLWADEGVGSKK